MPFDRMDPHMGFAGKVLPSWIIMATQPAPPPQRAPRSEIAGLSKGLLTILVSLNSMVVSGFPREPKTTIDECGRVLNRQSACTRCWKKCAWCGRTFNPTAMKSHAKSCTQETKKEVDAEKRMCYPVQLDILKVWMSGYLISGGWTEWSHI